VSDFAARREAMVEHQLAARGIGDPRLLDAFRRVPREAFIAEALAEEAYADTPLPIEEGQTISQPYVVAAMIAAAAIGAADKVLEIGAGSGYAAAILGCVAAEVIAIERHPALAESAAARLERLGISNVRILTGDGSIGLAAEAPFDTILAAASGREVPTPLKDQLRIGGRIVMPLGPPGEMQRLVRVVRTASNHWEEVVLGPVRFVPLIGAQGWSEDEAR
jgi:protein-L-isoaspartate(D-aspartate) O-methyltransferase